VQFNPITKTLYTNDNKLIKKMYCPYPSLQWDDLSSLNDNRSRFCDICESSVIDTKEYTDEALYTLLQEDPTTCLKVDWDQENIRIIRNVK